MKSSTRASVTSTTHAAHSDQASRVALRVLILAPLAGSACFVAVVSLKVGPSRTLYEETNSEKSLSTSPLLASLL